jgi:hypothetical protein
MVTLFPSSLLLLMHLSVLTFISCLFIVFARIQSKSREDDAVQFVPIILPESSSTNFKHFLDSLFFNQNASSGTAK